MKSRFKYGITVALCACLTMACGKSGGSSVNVTYSEAPETAPAVTEESKPSGTAPASQPTSETVPTSQPTSMTLEEAKERGFEGEIIDGGFVLEYYYSDEKVVVVPETIDGAPVVEIGANAFAIATIRADRPNVYEKIVLPSTVTKINEGAFWTCSNLKEIDLGTGLQSIEKMAFSGCSSLETVRFPEGMQSMTGVTFFECDSLKEVYIPASVTTVERIAFPESCPNLVVVTPAGSAAEQNAKDSGLPFRNE